MSKKKNKSARRKVMIDTIARARIDILMDLARNALQQGKDAERARRYVFIARKIAMRVRESMPWKYRRSTCRKCNSYLVPGCTSRVRVQGRGKNAHVAVTCNHCGNVVRYHIRRKPIATRPAPRHPNPAQRIHDHVVNGGE